MGSFNLYGQPVGACSDFFYSMKTSEEFGIFVTTAFSLQVASLLREKSTRVGVNIPIDLKTRDRP